MGVFFQFRTPSGPMCIGLESDFKLFFLDVFQTHRVGNVLLAELKHEIFAISNVLRDYALLDQFLFQFYTTVEFCVTINPPKIYFFWLIYQFKQSVDE